MDESHLISSSGPNQIYGLMDLIMDDIQSFQAFTLKASNHKQYRVGGAWTPQKSLRPQPLTVVLKSKERPPTVVPKILVSWYLE